MQSGACPISALRAVIHNSVMEFLARQIEWAAHTSLVSMPVLVAVASTTIVLASGLGGHMFSLCEQLCWDSCPTAASPSSV